MFYIDSSIHCTLLNFLATFLYKVRELVGSNFTNEKNLSVLKGILIRNTCKVYCQTLNGEIVLILYAVKSIACVMLLTIEKEFAPLLCKGVTGIEMNFAIG